MASVRALVTGASAGIGLALVKRFAEKGYTVYGCAPMELQSIKDIKSSNGSQVHAIRCDITDEQQVKAMFQEINETSGGLDICVNNAGISLDESILHGSPDRWRKIFDTNVIGPCTVTQYAVKSMVLGGGDDCRILNMNSIRGLSAPKYTSPTLSIYIGTKHAITGITSALRGELSREGLGSKIRVMQVSPGRVETDFVVSSSGQEAATASYAKEKSLLPDDIADCVIHALSAPKHSTIIDQVVWPTEVLDKL